MGNKTKPSSLLLVPSHHDFDDPGVLFKQKMLKWPIYGRSVHLVELDETVTSIYRNAIKGLMDISPFSAKISLEIDLANKRLSHPKRTWGEIYLNSEHVLSFSHYMSNNNQAFCTILEWPEIDLRGDQHALIFSTWDSKKWTEFFLERIKQEIASLETKAKAKRNDAIALENRAINLRNALSK